MEAIRRDFDAGMSERAIEREPPARKKIPREPTAMNGLHAIIDAMIEANPGIGTAMIWQHLADYYGATVAYHPLRRYVVRRRADMLSLPGGSRSSFHPSPTGSAPAASRTV
jgi:hypothetical protein